jgi:hypothetical protein
MIPVKIADFFEGLWSPSFGTPLCVVGDFLAPEPYTDEENITNYLRSGHEILSVMGSSQDVLGSDERILGGDSIFTDGEWIWRGDFWLYVRKHHVTVPGRFLAHIRGSGYSMPTVDRSRLLEILDYVESRW